MSPQSRVILTEETVPRLRAVISAKASLDFAVSAAARRPGSVGDTGAVIAATTTSIPEALGTPRTWDYR